MRAGTISFESKVLHGANSTDNLLWLYNVIGTLCFASHPDRRAILDFESSHARQHDLPLSQCGVNNAIQC